MFKYYLCSISIYKAVKKKKKTQKGNFKISCFSPLTPVQNKYEKLFLCIFSVQSVNASFSLKMPISYLHVFYFAMGEKKTILWIYMPCSAALEMHIQQRIKRFRERRSSLNSWEVKSEKNVANISFIGIHKGSLHSNIVFTRHKNAAFYFIF